MEDTPKHSEADIAKNLQIPTESTETSTTVDFEAKLRDDENDFAIYSLFEDLLRLCAENQSIWQRHKSGQVDIVQATLLAARILELAKECERELLEVLTSSNFTGDMDKRFPLGTYPACVAKIYNSKALGRGDKPDVTDENASRQVTAFDKFLLLPLGRTVTDFGYYTSKTPQEPKKYVCTPIPRAPVSSSDPEMHAARQEDILLIEAFHDMRLLEARLEANEDLPMNLRSTLPFLDVLHNALAPAWRNNKPSITAVFAARLLVDMRKICGPIGVSVQDAAVKKYAKGFDCLMESSDRPDLECPQDKAFEEIMEQIRKRLRNDLDPVPIWCRGKTADVDKMITQRDEMIRQLSKHRGEFSGTSLRELEKQLASLTNTIMPHRKDNFLVEANLLYGGSALVDLVASLELAGTDIATQTMSIQCMAHLYNALRKLGQLDMVWQEMDQVIEIQGSALFANDIPKTRKAMVDRFLYAIGLSRRGNDVPRLTGNKLVPRKFTISKTSVAIMNFFDGKESLSRLLYQLENDGPSIPSRRGMATKNVQKSPTKKATKPSASPTASATNEGRFRKTLQDLENHLDTELPIMTFDYITFTRKCTRMLSIIRGQLVSQPKVKYAYPESKDVPAGRPWSRVEVVMKCLYDAEKAEVAYDKAKRDARQSRDAEAMRSLPDTAPVGPQMEVAAKFFKKFLGQKA